MNKIYILYVSLKMNGIEYRSVSELAWSGQVAIQTITSASLSSRLTSFACLMSHVSCLTSKPHDGNTIALLQE